jgi:tetratricopeptide (TPR) repeat protein
VSIFLIALIGALAATNAFAAETNQIGQTNSISAQTPNPNAPAEKDFKKVQDDEQTARDEVDGWIQENQKFGESGAAIPAEELNRRIRKRFEVVKKEYQDFIAKYPKHAEARLYYGRFLGDLGDEDGQLEQLEKSRELDPSDADVWNDLANFYGHNSPVKKSFEYYAKAISLNPTEPIYFQNFATTVYLFRKDAKEYYHINEQQVFDKALDLYARALKLDPTNFPLATDLAQSYYGIKPTRTEDALRAWTNALNIAKTEVEREGVYVHLARFKLNAGRFAEARMHLNAVTNELYTTLKERLLKNLNERESETNRAAAFSATNNASAKTAKEK